MGHDRGTKWGVWAIAAVIVGPIVLIGLCCAGFVFAGFAEHFSTQ